MVGTADKELKEFWPRLSPDQKEVVLQVMKSYIIAKEPVIQELGVTLTEYNKDLEEADNAIQNGEFYTQVQIQKRIAGWKAKHSR